MTATIRTTVSLTLASAISLLGGVAAAQQAPDAKTPDLKLPPGWTMADMQACILAGTPGKMHQKLQEDVGNWEGKQTMWMSPGAEPLTSTVTSTCAPLMDGRFLKVDVKGEVPGMGPYNGLGIYGYDNVAQQYVAIWIDNHGTGIMTGTGKPSPDGKTITTNYNYQCPITKKPAVMREVETETGANTKRLETYGTDPKSGKEFKMMVIELTRK